jgi:hypothetical protein
MSQQKVVGTLQLSSAKHGVWVWREGHLWCAGLVIAVGTAILTAVLTELPVQLVLVVLIVSVWDAAGAAVQYCQLAAA